MPDPRPAARLRAPALWALGAVEAVSFGVLLVVAAAGGHPAALAVTGFGHGCVYLMSLTTAWRLVPDGRAQGLAVIPGVGALLMARHLTRRPVSPPVGPGRPPLPTRPGPAHSAGEAHR